MCVRRSLSSLKFVLQSFLRFASRRVGALCAKRSNTQITPNLYMQWMSVLRFVLLVILHILFTCFCVLCAARGMKADAPHVFLRNWSSYWNSVGRDSANSIKTGLHFPRCANQEERRLKVAYASALSIGICASGDPANDIKTRLRRASHDGDPVKLYMQLASALKFVFQVTL